MTDANAEGTRTVSSAIGADPMSEEESLHVAMVAYSKAASARETVERRLGAAATGLSAIVALSIFASLSTSPNVAAKIGAGILSAAAAALVALEKFSARAPSTALLKRAGEFAKLRSRLQVEGLKALAAVSSEHADLIGTAPTADEKYWVLAREQVGTHQPGA